MEPVSIVAAVAAASGAYILWNKVFKKDAAPPAAGVVSTLTQGKTYTVLAVITKAITDDPRWGAIPGSNEEKIKQLIASTFAQSGCKVLSAPTIRSQDDMKKALAGEPSTWVFNMQWLLPQPTITAVIPWLAGASFVQVPTA